MTNLIKFINANSSNVYPLEVATRTKNQNGDDIIKCSFIVEQENDGFIIDSKCFTLVIERNGEQEKGFTITSKGEQEVTEIDVLPCDAQFNYLMKVLTEALQKDVYVDYEPTAEELINEELNTYEVSIHCQASIDTNNAIECSFQLPQVYDSNDYCEHSKVIKNAWFTLELEKEDILNADVLSSLIADELLSDRGNKMQKLDTSYLCTDNEYFIKGIQDRLKLQLKNLD